MKRPPRSRPSSDSTDAPAHRSILLDACIDGVLTDPAGIYIDGTYGAGGHTRALLARLEPGGRILALDVDDTVPAPEDARVELVRANYRDLARVLDERGLASIDGVLLDIGVSSMQLDRAERGFSFMRDGPLDMRMDPHGERSAYDLLAELGEAEIADVIYRYGEERASRRVARAIVTARTRGALPTRTAALAQIVASAVGRSGRVHPATRTFQALRIAVNDELAALEDGLSASVHRTRPGGRIAVLTFHSLEDRIVKTRFRSDPRLQPLTKKPVVPPEAELAENPRARSAKLRVAERLA